MLFAQVDFGLSAILAMVGLGYFTMQATRFIKKNPEVSSTASKGIVDILSRLMK